MAEKQLKRRGLSEALKLNELGLPKKKEKASKILNKSPKALKLSNNLRALMSEFPGLNESELARRTGIGQPVVHRICSGETDNPKVATLSPIANFFTVSISQLIGDEPLPDDRIPGSYSQNIHTYQRIPILDWQQVLTWPELQLADKHLPTLFTNQNVGENGYAVLVADTTMEPRFPEGTQLLINRELTPRNRDFVVVHIEGEEFPHFKQLLIDGNNYYLKPFHPDFRAFLLDKPYRLLGTMVEAQWIPMGYPAPFSKDKEEDIF